MLAAGRDPAELEREAPVTARLADRCRLHGVESHAFEPTGLEDERRFLDLLARVDVKRDSSTGRFAP